MIQTKSSILCALCGIKFKPTMGSICPTCTIKSLEQQKILQGQDINYCRYCMRFQRPPWINCERQGQEMMAILLKKIKGLNKVQLQHASFVWTEPHSKRMKLKVVFNREISQNMKIQVTEVVQFVQKYTQCNDCRKKFTPHDWVALIQLRQQSSHKKTILNLQQILLKQKLMERIMKTQEADGGLDLYFSTQNDANRLVDFFKSRFPVSLKSSSKLISHNQRENTSNVKTTYSCIIPKVCKDDLVHIPRKLSKQLGSCCQVLLCTKVSSSLHFLDVSNFKKIQISATQYFLYESMIQIYQLKSYGRTYTVLDSQIKQAETANKYPMFGLTILKQNQTLEQYANCHFNEQPGNQLVGFQLSDIQNIEGVKGIPDYVMVLRVRNKDNKKKMKGIKRKKQAEERRKERESQIASRAQEQNHQDIPSDGDDMQSWEDVDEQNQDDNQNTHPEHPKEQAKKSQQKENLQQKPELDNPKRKKSQKNATKQKNNEQAQDTKKHHQETKQRNEQKTKKKKNHKNKNKEQQS